jgi:hypothetical protein
MGRWRLRWKGSGMGSGSGILEFDIGSTGSEESMEEEGR